MSIKKSIQLLSALTLLAANSSNSFGSDEFKPKKKYIHNETKKCFRDGCNNHRTGDSLYCSIECQQVYHKYLKDKEANKY